MPTLDTYLGEYLWMYIPNLPAAIAFAALFIFLTIAHIRKMIKLRTWFCVPFVVGGIFEAVGYTSRAIATHHTGSLAPFLLQAVFLLLPPCFFAGTISMVFSRVVRAVHGARFSLVAPRWGICLFVGGDLLCLNIQSTGAGFLPKPHLGNVGNGVVVAGLGLQVVIFAGFMCCCLRFHGRFRAHLAATGEIAEIPWESVLCMLYGTSIIISIRNVFRLVEFIAGHDSYLFENEWPMYVFDGVLMLLSMIGFYVWYPPQLQPSSTHSMIELTSEDNSNNSEYRPVRKYPQRTM